jgi:hypothetical protein
MCVRRAEDPPNKQMSCLDSCAPTTITSSNKPPTLFQKICNQQPTPKQPFFFFWLPGYI